MSSLARTRLPSLLSPRTHHLLLRHYATKNSTSPTTNDPPPAQSTPNAPLPANTNDSLPANDPSPKPQVQTLSSTNAMPVAPAGNWDYALQETVEEGEQQRQAQAPNRAGVWSRSQQPRSTAMSGPRFEQTIMEYQPQPYAAIDLIHKQPVRWIKNAVVSCDGGGGALGHPRIFINVDKPQINWCTYCGLPFAKEAHRAYLESLPSTPYPLAPTGDAAEVNERQRVSDEPYGQR